MLPKLSYVNALKVQAIAPKWLERFTTNVEAMQIEHIGVHIKDGTTHDYKKHKQTFI